MNSQITKNRDIIRIKDDAKIRDKVNIISGNSNSKTSNVMVNRVVRSKKYKKIYAVV